MNLWVP